jgi:hypothetical protein
MWPPDAKGLIMTKPGKKKTPQWPVLTIDCPDDVTGKLLLYWDDIFTPQEGQWEHPTDKVKHKKYRAAIKVLMEFFGD